MSEFDDFIDDLLVVAPDIATDLESCGYDVRPDVEIPVSWAGWVGRSTANVFGQLSPEARADAFAVVERYLVAGSELLSTAIATGYLESIANSVSARRLSASEVAAVLGPESRAYIDAWDQFTLGHSSLDPS